MASTLPPREQSRVVMVEGVAGRTRPMYFREVVDDFGNVHCSGRAVLARPRISRFNGNASVWKKISVPSGS